MQQQVAVFVDGENIGSTHAAAILPHRGGAGRLSLARVYGDLAKLNGWQEARATRSFTRGQGKNATDLLLSLDALELALDGTLRSFASLRARTGTSLTSR